MFYAYTVQVQVFIRNCIAVSCVLIKLYIFCCRALRERLKERRRAMQDTQEPANTDTNNLAASATTSTWVRVTDIHCQNIIKKSNEGLTVSQEFATKIGATLLTH